MKGLTDYLTKQPWEDTIIAPYLLVSDCLVMAYQVSGFARSRGPDPEYDDAQIITIALVAEFWFAGNEALTLHFLRQYHARLWSTGLPDTARCNVRRRALQDVLAAIRALLRDEWRQAHPLADASDSAAESELIPRLRVVDSAPVGAPQPWRRKIAPNGLGYAPAPISNSLADACMRRWAWTR